MTRFPRAQREELRVSLFEISRAFVLPGNFYPRVFRGANATCATLLPEMRTVSLPVSTDVVANTFVFTGTFFRFFQHIFFRNEADEINLESWQSSNPPSRQS